jgi:hypothetical protein
MYLTGRTLTRQQLQQHLRNQNTALRYVWRRWGGDGEEVGRVILTPYISKMAKFSL